MSEKIIAFLRRLHFPALLMLSVFPPALLISNMPQTMAVFALCALSVAACIALPAKLRLAAAALFAAGLFALSMHLGLSVLLCAVCCLTLFASLRISHNTLYTTPPFFYLCGVASHLFTQTILRAAFVNSDTSPRLLAQLALLTLLYLTLLLLTFNGISLDNASQGRHRLPASVRRINALLTLCFLALALLLSSAPAIASAVVSLWHMTLTALAWLDALLMRLLPAAQETGGGMLPPSAMLPALEPLAEPSRLAILLERIASVLAAVVVAAGGAFLLWRLFVLLRLLVRRLIRRLHSYVLIVSDDYVDEISDTREEDGEHAASRPTRARRRAAAYARTPEGVIRARYAQLLRRHPAWHASSTARENLPAPSAALYERARYSSHPVTQDDADRFSAGTRQI